LEFQVTILGSNSAAPAHGRNQTSQIVTYGRHQFMVDCGEGTQHQLRRFHVKSSKIDHVFISHLHGDHYLGLMGMISTFHLNNRKSPLYIFGPPGLDEIITQHLKYSHTQLKFPLFFNKTTPKGKNLLLELENLRIYSFPLKHRIPCTAFIFEEKYRQQKLIKEKIVGAGMAVEEIQSLLQGRDVINIDGSIKYQASEYIKEPVLPRKYAFCSDTVFDPSLISLVNGVDLLYHESTFMEADKDRAKLTLHSTAEEAAIIAKNAQVKELLLGHFSVRYIDLYPLLWEAKAIFEATHLSEEGRTYAIR
jgi:ribonuclease Z